MANPNPLILVVDDDAMNREILEEFLHTGNFRVNLARDGQSALASIANEKPDLVILDVRMPDMSGFDVCERIKSDAATANTPVIIVTGYDSPEDRQRGAQVGADAFLGRPYSGDDLIQQVRDLLAR